MHHKDITTFTQIKYLEMNTASLVSIAMQLIILSAFLRLIRFNKIKKKMLLFAPCFTEAVSAILCLKHCQTERKC